MLLGLAIFPRPKKKVEIRHQPPTTRPIWNRTRTVTRQAKESISRLGSAVKRWTKYLLTKYRGTRLGTKLKIHRALATIWSKGGGEMPEMTPTRLPVWLSRWERVSRIRTLENWPRPKVLTSSKDSCRRGLRCLGLARTIWPKNQRWFLWISAVTKIWPIICPARQVSITSTMAGKILTLLRGKEAVLSRRGPSWTKSQKRALLASRSQ